jgi:penicillin-binding protein 2
LKGGKYNAHAIAERLRDNALFTAFAPADKPRIAIAMVVENAGFGATYAAPIVRKALDYYLLGKRQGEKNKTPVPKEDAEPVPVEEYKAAAGIHTEFQPGGETPGNKD